MNDNHRIFNSSSNNNINARAREPPPPPPPQPVARQRQPASRRARLADFYNTTRSSYIPAITSSISNLVSSTDDSYQLPSNSKIFIYDTYTIQNQDEYLVNVYGYLYCPGTMTRKNRLLLTLARQLTKSSSSASSTAQAADQFQGELGEKLENPDQYNEADDDSSVYSMESSASSTVSINTESILKERLEGFMTRSLPQNQLRVVIGSESKLDVDSLTNVETISDDNGHFKLELKTKYKPSVVQVSCMANEEIVNFKEVKIIEDKPGISFISDIDDTVKLTGVVSDKRDMFRNVFVKNFKDLEIPGFVNWFNLVSSKDCKIHYVSNSPWQLLRPIKNYFEAIGLPYDSIHLKQYSGNVISALMEPSSERKKSTLIKIVSDFPQRKFILIGDTGEKDLEAYLTLSKLFPSQILTIYMRVVPTSLSDFDDKYVYDSILKLLELRKKNPDTDRDLIDLYSDVPTSPKSSKLKLKLSPIIPKKPSSLRGHILNTSSTKNEQEETPPKLPNRRVQTFDVSSNTEANQLPHRAATEAGVMNQNNYDAIKMSKAESHDPVDSSHLAPNSIYNTSNVMNNLDMDDKRGDLWKERMIRVMNELPEKVEIKFFKDVDEILEESLRIINEIN